MIGKIIIFILVSLSTVTINGEEIFSLKTKYEVEIEIEGTDQNSIKQGMQNAFSSLLISLSGNSTILDESSVKKALKNPEKYINQYKLEVTENGLISIFSFHGDSLRLFLSQNSLPLWVSKKPLILSFLPCKEDSSYSIDIEEIVICDALEGSLFELSQRRNSKVMHPIMDLRDITYFDSLNSFSATKFMNKMNRRYLTSSWLLCFTRDSFGILLESPLCQSSESSDQRPLKQTFNELLDKLNIKESLVVDKSRKNKTLIKVAGVSDFSNLEKLVGNINSQVLVFDTLINEIKDDEVLISISHYGKKEDLLSLLGKNSGFEQIILQSGDIISYKYLNT